MDASAVNKILAQGKRTTTKATCKCFATGKFMPVTLSMGNNAVRETEGRIADAYFKHPVPTSKKNLCYF